MGFGKTTAAALGLMAVVGVASAELNPFSLVPVSPVTSKVPGASDANPVIGSIGIPIGGVVTPNFVPPTRSPFVPPPRTQF
jgi:hypothetical protein